MKCRECKRNEDARTKLGGICLECVAKNRWFTYRVGRMVGW